MTAEPRELAAVGLGGACGCLLRAGLGGQVPTTLALNLLGALALGVLLGSLGQHHRLLRLALGTGVLGGLTTHSTFILQSQQLLVQGRLLPGAAYLLGAFAAGVASAGLGLWLGGLLRHHGRARGRRATT
ncbi:fluoride efflux transporter FluC [Actinomyces bowdenii]|uniref:Fluoride-specific ion channel FluC n=1 Tax=Actinomyces bowdenii TaxID=131109 RepID=A0A853EHC8_9ACTO|nr:CrcB family protein [Actinomyces bowdenii]MBF0696516.1 CrcB family protein [Actinomyces bowdenii]NYS68689.1 CrcB family protein [Actinomyces bowdenii]